MGFEFDFDFLFDLPIFVVLGYVIVAIMVDFIFGVITAIKDHEFDFKELPRFLATNILPYVLGLFILAVVANYMGEVFHYIFYATTVFVFARYVAKIVEKVKYIFWGEV